MEFIQYCSDIGGFLGYIVLYILLKRSNPSADGRPLLSDFAPAVDS